MVVMLELEFELASWLRAASVDRVCVGMSRDRVSA
jgi:hypothetical protein